MSENLDRVCEALDSIMLDTSTPIPDKVAERLAWATAVIRAEFAELERQAKALDKLREFVAAEENEMYSMFKRLDERNNLAMAAAWNTRAHDMRRVFAKLDSLAKGGRDADDVP